MTEGFQKKLDAMIQKIEADPRNASYTEKGIPPVFQIHEHARILIVGQAPGRKVQESLIPFHDASGKKLMEWLGMDADTFYSESIGILPMDFYYPGKGKTGDLPPRKFMKEYQEDLLALMPDIELKVLVGRYGIEGYLGKSMERNLTETVRHYQNYLPACFPIVHPSPLNIRWLKKNPWFEEEVIPALQEKVRTILDH